jgi:putative ABC transport system ATP-binding protein
MLALAFREVHKHYTVGDATVVALDGANLEVAQNEFVGLVGPSGSGKSTALSIAGALLTPTTGHVAVGAVDLSTLTGRRRTTFRREHVGFVFQSHNLVPYLTARENLLVVAQGRAPDVRRRAGDLLAELGLGDRVDRLATRLSAGERQRVAIGRALMNSPALLLVDEPTSALDTERGLQVMQLLRDEVKRRGTAGVVVTHDTRMVDVCDRVIGIRDGRIGETAEPAVPADVAKRAASP